MNRFFASLILRFILTVSGHTVGHEGVDHVLG